MLAVGTWIDGRYEVGRPLGRGGMADVVLAEDHHRNEPVAVKVLRNPDHRHLARFGTEIAVLQRLDHPAVVRLRDTGYHDAHPYLVLDLVDGPTLAGLIATGPLGLPRSITTAEHVASALAHAHRSGIVHRDVKPSNVLFDEQSSQCRLTDFGIARLTDATRVTTAGACIGTAAYLAPEQLEGEAGSPADIYALGLVLLESLTGLLCYPGTAAESAIARLYRSPVVPADLPLWLRHTIRTMTARDPDDRPSAEAVAAALADRSADPLGVSPITAAGLTARLPADRHAFRLPKRLVAAAAVAMVASLGGLTLAAQNLHFADPPADASPSPEPAGAHRRSTDAAHETASTPPPTPATTTAAPPATTTAGPHIAPPATRPTTSAPPPSAGTGANQPAPDAAAADKPPKPPKAPKDHSNGNRNGKHGGE